MRPPSWELALTRDYLIGIAPFIAGLVVVAILILAVWLEFRLRERESRPTPEPKPRSGAWQTRQEYGHETPPDHGPGHQETPQPPQYEVMENREPDEIPPGAHRYLPHELHHHGTRRREDEEGKTPEEGRHRWSRGGSGHGTG